jgi:hypothetical protein
MQRGSVRTPQQGDQTSAALRDGRADFVAIAWTISATAIGVCVLTILDYATFRMALAGSSVAVVFDGGPHWHFWVR